MMKGLSTILVLVFAASAFADQIECISGPSNSYAGTRSTTKFGYTCQRWDVQAPHKPTHVPTDGGHHNYCRNPDNDSRGNWCYTIDPEVRWQYCGIPKCDVSVHVVWSANDERGHSAFFQYVKADPELLMQNTENFQSSLDRKDYENSRFRAVATDKSGEKIFFTDIENNYLGVFNTKTLQVQRYLQREAADIYAIAQDYLTGNVYWTDTRTKSVMVSGELFQSSVEIYKSATAEPHGIVVLQKERKVVFSTYTAKKGSQIVMVDMAGDSSKVLLDSSVAIDITGLDVDSERIYWSENLGYGSRIRSMLFDGSKQVEHHFEKKGSFEDIAVYSDYIYVTDSRVRYNYFDDIRYNMKVVGKVNDKTFTITKPDLPHGIAILREVDESELPSGGDAGLVQCQSRCGGVCLSESDGKYSCKCASDRLMNRITGGCVAVKAKLEDDQRPAIKKNQG